MIQTGTHRTIVAAAALATAALALAGCGASSKHSSTSTAAVFSGSRTERIVESEIVQHIKALNHGEGYIKTLSCKRRGSVPSMGEGAVAFLCTFDGETAHADLWAWLPKDQEEPVMPLDLTAEQELAARGEYAGLKDGHSEEDNRSAEEDVRNVEEEVSKEDSTTTTSTSVEASVASGSDAKSTKCYYPSRSVSGFTVKSESVTVTDHLGCTEGERFIAAFLERGIALYHSTTYATHDSLCKADTGWISCVATNGAGSVDGEYQDRAEAAPSAKEVAAKPVYVDCSGFNQRTRQGRRTGGAASGYLRTSGRRRGRS